MKRKPVPADQTGAALTTPYRLAGTDRLVRAIADFGHDYRESFHEIKPARRGALPAHPAGEPFTHEVSRNRAHYGRAVDSARLTRDPATRELLLDD